MSDDFKTVTTLMNAIHAHVKSYRWEVADKLRLRADDVELEMLKEPDAVEQARLEGFSEGLRTAAAVLDPEQVRA